MKKKRSKLTNKSNDEPWKWNSEEMMDKKKNLKDDGCDRRGVRVGLLLRPVKLLADHGEELAIVRHEELAQCRDHLVGYL